MTERPWTPGPWVCLYEGSGDWTVMEAKEVSREIASVHDYKRSVNNYDLIALAPEMAEAILEESWDCSSHHGMDPANIQRCKLCSLAEQLLMIKDKA